MEARLRKDEWAWIDRVLLIPALPLTRTHPRTVMIHLSQAAIAEVQRLKLSGNKPEGWFRLAVQPGGCQQFHYALGFVDHPEASDQVFQYESIWVAIAIDSIPYLEGLSIDYTEDLMGGGFRFRNPNSSQDCGCGNSFAVLPPADSDRSPV